MFALGHLIIATVGIAISTAIFFFMLKPVLSLFVSASDLSQSLSLKLQLFPLQSSFGFAAGYCGTLQRNAFSRDASARYVWIIPTIWFMLCFLAWTPSSVFVETRWDHFFWSTIPSSKGFQLLTTLPLLTSASYAFGSYVAVRRAEAS